MTFINLSYSHLYKTGYSTVEIIRMVKALESAGFHVNLHIKGQEGMKLLEQIPAMKKHQMTDYRLGLANLILIGVLASLTLLFFGWGLL